MLSEKTILDVVDAAVAVSLNRDAVMAGIDDGLVDNIRKVGDPKQQLLVDLYTLDKAGVIADGSRPLRAWLVKAERIARPRLEAGVFERALAELDTAVRAAEAPPAREEPSHTSIVLDRILHWDALVERCRRRDREHVAIVVHGSMDQDLHLFLLRIRSYLNDECGWPHAAVHVERSRDGTTARTADEWKRCLVQASRARRGELDFVLRVQAADAPVLLVFSENDGPLRLDEATAGGLIQFLRGQLDPAIVSLEAQGALAHPVRVVIPIEHAPAPPGALDAMVLRIDQALRGARGLRAERLPPLELPIWPEVEEHIKKKVPDADTTILAECAVIHRSIFGSPDRTLQRLGDALDGALVEWMQRKHYGY